MSVSYHKRSGALVPDSVCRHEQSTTAQPPCQSISGQGIDKALAALVLEQLNPLAIEAALEVSAELAQRACDADRMRASTVTRAQYAADAARRRYLAVDPTNRLVVDTLEADWNQRLRELHDTQEEYQRACQTDKTPLSNEQQTKIRALVSDLPALFNDPATPLREKKRLIRLLVTDVTLTRDSEQITAHVRLSGGQLHTIVTPGRYKPGRHTQRPPARSR